MWSVQLALVNTFIFVSSEWWWGRKRLGQLDAQHGPSAGAAGGDHPQPGRLLHGHREQDGAGPDAKDHHAPHDQQRKSPFYTTASVIIETLL